MTFHMLTSPSLVAASLLLLLVVQELIGRGGECLQRTTNTKTKKSTMSSYPSRDELSRYGLKPSSYSSPIRVPLSRRASSSTWKYGSDGDVSRGSRKIHEQTSPSLSSSTTSSSSSAAASMSTHNPVNIRNKYIVHLKDSYHHDDIERYLDSLVSSGLMKQHIVHSRLHNVFRGLVIELSNEGREVFVEGEATHHPLDQTMLENIPGVERVSKDSLRYLRVLPEYLSLANQKDSINKIKLSERVQKEGKEEDDEEKKKSNKNYITLQRDLADGLWGLDRIDQQALPMNSQYNPHFTGKGVDVYVVDTGLDSLHDEFSNGRTGSSIRSVKNIYDAFAKTKNAPAANTDGQGHGTHVAGTVGGINVGVSPEVSIFGVKVLSDAGEGATTDIVTALEFVLTQAKGSGRRSIVTMSLGGPCDVADCSRDSLVVSSEKLISNNIVLSVAAGNEGCNACYGSPNAAPHTINVGASDENDELCYFSNFGQCIDIIAPGWDILSSCSSKVCGAEDYYLSMSGTSMATPHVAGVIAQILQKYPSATPAQVVDFLTCDSAHEVVKLDPRDSITRNLLLNVPSSTSSTCDPSAGCDPACWQQGSVCLPQYAPSNSYHASATSAVNTCHCDAGFYGPTCSSITDPACTASNNIKQTVVMYDSFGDGWSYTSYYILDSNGNLFDNSFDSLCYDDYGTKDYCLTPGNYQFVLGNGPFPTEISWSFCNNNGGAPFEGNFEISSDGKFTCKMTCNGGKSQSMTLLDSYEDGWGGAYYALYNENGTQMYGGTLASDTASVTHNLCLLPGTYYLMFPYIGSYPEEVSLSINGKTMYVDDFAILVIDSNLNAIVSIPQVGSCSAGGGSAIGLTKYNLLNKGWQSATYSIKDASTNAVVATNGMSNGFVELDTLCLPDGCYNFNVDYKSTDSKQIADNAHSLWTACGDRGYMPWVSRFCVESHYNLCYGISGAPYAKSYSPHSAGQYLFVSHHDEDYDMVVIDVLSNVHGINDFSSLSDGAYAVQVGAGKELVANKNSVYFSCDLNAAPVAMSIQSGVLSIGDNTTSCTLSHVVQSSCTASNTIPLLFSKVDLNGDGWGTAKQAKYVISDMANKQIVSGNLLNGQFGVDKLCLAKSACYKLSVTSTSYPEEVLWVHCGMIGGAGTSYTNLHFCVTATGCYFTDPLDDTYDKVIDDDFPRTSPSMVPTKSPSRTPTVIPTLRAPTWAPSTKPPVGTLAPTTPDEHSAAPSLIPSESPTHAPTEAPTNMPFFPPTSPPTIKPFLVFDTNVEVTLNLNFVDQSSSKSATDGQLRFIEYATRQAVEEAGLGVWESSILNLDINGMRNDKVFSKAQSSNFAFAVGKKKTNTKTLKVKSSVVRSLSALKKQFDVASNSMNSMNSIIDYDESSENHAARTLLSTQSVEVQAVTRVHMAIEWKSSASVLASADLVAKLDQIIRSSIASGAFQANLDYSLRYFQDHSKIVIPILTSSVLKCDVLSDVPPARTVDPQATPAADDAFDQITWPIPMTDNDNNNNNNNQASSGVLLSLKQRNDLIIGLVVGCISGCAILALYRRYVPASQYKSLSKDSLHGSSSEMEMSSSKFNDSTNGRRKKKDGSKNIDKSKKIAKKKNKRNIPFLNINTSKGFFLSANEPKSPTSEADLENGGTWTAIQGDASPKPNGAERSGNNNNNEDGEDDGDYDDDGEEEEENDQNEVVNVIHLNRQFDTKHVSKK